ncbi:MAG: orotidine-5'-phosphate decarboxylase [Oligoflexia bacterium]|nr:orotidine-5'-phosphate decarboxylase [Oligoflexia bacterium]
MVACFGDRLADAVDAVGAPLCVGLDPHLDRLPASLRARFAGLSGGDFRREAAAAVADFDQIALQAVVGIAAAVKPQLAFYEALGSPGMAALERTCSRARELGLLVIADAKRGDIASTARAYATALLDPKGPLGADAVTLSPWMGLDVVDPFLELCRDHGRGIFVLVRTTNPGSAFLQRHGQPQAAVRLAQALGKLGAGLMGVRGLSAVGAVVGAFSGDQARRLRAQMPGAWFLVPGVGAQGGDLSQALAGRRSDGMGSLVVSARGILFPPAGTEDDHVGAAIGERARTLARGLAAA